MRFLLSFVALGLGGIIAASQFTPARAPLAGAAVPYSELPSPQPLPVIPGVAQRTGGSNANAEPDDVAPTRGGGRGPGVAAEPLSTTAAAKAADADDRTRARTIQTQLKKVGCYSGPINGEWASGSKRAMAEFLEAVNATLPVEQPDAVLAALVASHPDVTCGEPSRVADAKEAEETATLTRQPPRDAAPRRVVEERREPRRPAWTQNVFDKVFGGG